MFSQHMDCEIALCLVNREDALKLEQLIELFVSGSVEVVSGIRQVEDVLTHGDKRVLIVDFDQFKQQCSFNCVGWLDVMAGCKLIVLDCPEDEDVGLFLLKAGAAGIFPPHVPSEVLLKGLGKIIAGDLWFPRKVLNRFVVEHQRSNTDTDVDQSNEIVAQPSLEQLCLSRRERDVLELLCEGACNDEIAERLYISIHTVKSHVSHILHKTHTRSRLDVVHWAITHGQVNQAEQAKKAV